MPDRRSYIDENGDAAELDDDFFANAVRCLPPALAGAGRDCQARVNALLRRALDLQS